jgi:acyl carrier protein
MLNDEKIVEMIKYILLKQGKKVDNITLDSTLRDISFRSLDFAELCLRIEEEIGRELNFEGSELRAIVTVADVCKFIKNAI